MPNDCAGKGEVDFIVCADLIACVAYLEITDLPVYLLCSNDAPGDASIAKLMDSLVNKPGFGTRCMRGDPIL